MRSTLQVLLLVTGLLLTSGSFGNISDARTLRFYHTHTGRSLEVTYYARGAYDRLFDVDGRHRLLAVP